jgi:phage terminase small subunit
MALSDKQRVFVDEYLVDLNATQAAIRAGYSQKNGRHSGVRSPKKT